MSGPIDWGFSWIWNRLFAFSPEVTKSKGVLIAKTCWKANLFSFGFAGRSVTIDPARRLVRIRKRTFWFAIHSRFVPFDAIREVTYGFQELSPFSSWTAHQEEQLFQVGLRLAPPEYVLLFRFYGHGEFVNNGIWPDWMHWDDFLESAISMNSMDGDSRAFAEVISGLIGVPIGSN